MTNVFSRQSRRGSAATGSSFVYRCTGVQQLFLGFGQLSFLRTKQFSRKERIHRRFEPMSVVMSRTTLNTRSNEKAAVSRAEQTGLVRPPLALRLLLNDRFSVRATVPSNARLIRLGPLFRVLTSIAVRKTDVSCCTPRKHRGPSSVETTAAISARTDVYRAPYRFDSEQYNIARCLVRSCASSPCIRLVKFNRSHV